MFKTSGLHFNNVRSVIMKSMRLHDSHSSVQSFSGISTLHVYRGSKTFQSHWHWTYINHFCIIHNVPYLKFSLMMPIDQVRSILPALKLRREQPPMQAKWVKLDMRYALETTLCYSYFTNKFWVISCIVLLHLHNIGVRNTFRSHLLGEWFLSANISLMPLTSIPSSRLLYEVQFFVNQC